MSASTALWVMLAPQVGPTSLDRHRRRRPVRQAAEDAGHLVRLGRADDRSRCSASFASTFRVWVLPLPSVVMVAPPRPSGVSALCAWRHGHARRRHLPGGAPDELDAVVEALHAERDQARRDHERETHRTTICASGRSRNGSARSRGGGTRSTSVPHRPEAIAVALTGPPPPAAASPRATPKMRASVKIAVAAEEDHERSREGVGGDDVDEGREAEHEGEALHGADREQPEHERAEERHGVGGQDRAVGALEAPVHRRADRAAGAHFVL